MNYSNNFDLFNLDFTQTHIPLYQNTNLISYQELYYPQYFFIDQNLLFQPSLTILNDGFQPLITSYLSIIDPKSSISYQSTQESHPIQNQAAQNQLHFRLLADKYSKNQSNQASNIRKPLSLNIEVPKNNKLSQPILEKPSKREIKYKQEFNNQQQIDDKKIIQNLRYQRKNIEANIVNKIYTFLKTCLKLGQKSAINFTKKQEKAFIYFKVLQKLQKAKKQNIKREFLKSLISMQQSLPGYNKIAKQLQKKGQSIQQFEYNIRVIIKNYLRLDAINSILTSKKMNPQLWKDHIEKVRELDQYLFSNEERQNSL